MSDRKSRESAKESESFADVLFAETPEPTVTYRSEWAAYEESLTKGAFVGRGWNGSGFINHYDGRISPGESFAPQAFWLEIDGQLLASDWKWAGFEKIDEEKGGTHVVVSLDHAVRPVSVRVHTKLDGTPVLARWIEVTNLSDRPAALSAAFSWSGAIQKTPRWRSHLDGTSLPLYSIGYFDSSRWGREGDFRWFDLPNAGFAIDGRWHRDRHRHPMFVLRNNATGQHFIAQLAWTGGYRFEFDLNPECGEGDYDRAAMLTFRAGPDAPAPQRILAPGETISTPEVHMGMVFGDLDAALQAMHDHLRRSVFLPQPRGRGGWIESGIGPEIEITTEEVYHAIDAAAEAGVEVFFIDASWYAAPGGNWWSTVGDWEESRERFPDGLAAFREKAHEKGMLWGLWMDAERVGDESRVAKEHPDWLAAAYDGERRYGGLLDLTRPEVAKWMEDQIARVVEEYQLDFFRLDYNTHPGPGIATWRDGYVENGYWRYYEALYGVYDRIRERFPNLILENCAGGGGRTDIGMVRRFSHTWVTDWQLAPRSFSITNGMTMALPPEYVDRLVGGQSGHTTADFDFQARLLLFVQPTFGFLHPIRSRWNPLMLARMRRWTDLYKNFVRPFMSEGRIYHHTPEIVGPEPSGWGVLELASKDRSRGICGLFQLAAPTQPEYLLRLRGLDVSRRYRVTWENSGRVCEIDGFELMKRGVTVRLEGALTSELLLFEDATADD